MKYFIFTAQFVNEAGSLVTQLLGVCFNFYPSQEYLKKVGQTACKTEAEITITSYSEVSEIAYNAYFGTTG